jgi:hypothetical protein
VPIAWLPPLEGGGGWGGGVLCGIGRNRQGQPAEGAAKRRCACSLVFGKLARFPLVLAGYADATLIGRLAELYGLSLPLDEHFAASTNDVAMVLALIAGADVIVPSTDVAVVSALRQRSVVRLDVKPALDLELTLGIVEGAGRTRVPAATRAFDLVRRFFAAVAMEVAAQRGLRPRGAQGRKGSG